MSAESKSTRIPKFSFGFRKTNKVEDGTHSNTVHEESTEIHRSATPQNPPSGQHSADSSPKVTRSKSLRIPRPTKYGYKSSIQTSATETHHNGFNEDDDIMPDVKSVRRIEGSASPRGPTHTITSSSSNHSSRSNSPGVTGGGTTAADKRLRGVKSGSGLRGEGVASGYSLSQSEDSVDDSYFDRTQRRTQSFSSKLHTHVRTGSHGNSEKLVPPGSGQFGRNHPSRRSKTPTSSYRTTSSGLQQKRISVGTSGGGGVGGKNAISRTTSLGKVNRIQRMENGRSSSPQPVQKSVVARRPSAESRGKRPVSMSGNNTPDLNSLAQEITFSDPPPHSKVPRSHVSKLPPPLKSRRSQSALDHHPPTYARHTPSPTDPHHAPSTTSQAASSNSSNEGPGMKSYEQPTISSTAKCSRPGSSNSHYRTNRQGSFGSQSNLSTMSTDSSRREMSKKKSLTNLDMIDGGSGSGRATPTSESGRSTPVGRGSRKGRESVDSGTVTSTTGKFGAGLPPRTPYRVARTMVAPSSGPVGINELEGSVLLEADDYLRVCHDVKALKTSLLRLKRELQTDSSSTPSTGSTAVSRVTRNRPSPSTDPSGVSVADLKKKLKAMTSERDKSLEEASSLKKKLNSRIASLTSELSALKSDHSKLEEEFKQVEGHRDMLLDKVERLHADKHKLEDRLTSYEKAQIYEQTLSESWLEDVDGDDTLMEDDTSDMEVQSAEFKSTDETVT